MIFRNRFVSGKNQIKGKIVMRACPYATYELTSSPRDIKILREFYNSIFTVGFPDPNERESLVNMERYLELKAKGWYKKNNYHILMYLENQTPIACIIIDYLAAPNTGIIEFVIVKPTLRQCGLGANLLEWAENELDIDSRRAGNRGWDYLVAEVNDPFKTNPLFDSMDEFDRTLIWDRWGFKRIRFPYIQPALSRKTEPVYNSLLVCKVHNTNNLDHMPSPILKQVIYNFIIWAMRIENPNLNNDFREMERFLEKRKNVELASLAKYVGAKSIRKLIFSDLATIGFNDLVRELQTRATEDKNDFSNIPGDFLKHFSLNTEVRDKSYNYHLFSIKKGSRGPLKGLVLFFTLPSAGFGSYIRLVTNIHNKEYLSEVITNIERAMVMDKKSAKGWYIECDADSKLILEKCGFFEIDIIYRRPPIIGQSHHRYRDAPILHLMYKEFGDNFKLPSLKTVDFLDNINLVFSIEYGLKKTKQSDYYKSLSQQLTIIKNVNWVVESHHS